MDKYLRQYLKWCITGKVQFQFLGGLLLVLTKFTFWKKDCALGYNSIKF